MKVGSANLEFVTNGVVLTVNENGTTPHPGMSTGNGSNKAVYNFEEAKKVVCGLLDSAAEEASKTA